MVVASALAFIVLKMLVGTKPLVAILGGIGLGVYLPHMIIGMKGNKRIKNFLKYFPESIDAMVRGIRSGLPITESISVVAEEMPDPIGTEFQAIRDNIRMGRGLEESMWDVAKRIDIPEFRYLIIALSIQRETGGNLAETLGNVAEVLRRRRQLKLKIKAMSSEAKASAMILGALPFIMILVLGAVSPEYIGTLFNDPRGNMLCFIAIGIMGTGIYIMAQMINFEI
jgi:tight adherence protein B